MCNDDIMIGKSCIGNVKSCIGNVKSCIEIINEIMIRIEIMVEIMIWIEITKKIAGKRSLCVHETDSVSCLVAYHTIVCRVHH